MKRFAIFLGMLMVPVAALALDFTNSAAQYKDVTRFSTSDRAGISVLTNLGAISGYPDGTFLPNLNVNRAEFLKIVLGSNKHILATQSDAASCFPDVHQADWFSRYVCLSKNRDILVGYPDGLFHPERNVNYAEALKILVNLFGLNSGGVATDPWYQQFADDARTNGLLFKENIPFDTLLTRGQVARLAAAFRAESDGQLAQYRAFERGETISSVSSTSSTASHSSTSSVATSSSSSATSVSSSSSSSSASSIPSTTLFPSQSHFLLVGRESPPVFDGTFTSLDEDAAIRAVDVTMVQEVRSLKALTLIDANGTRIATLTMVPESDNNLDHLKWRTTIVGSGAYILRKNSPTMLGFLATLKTRAEGGQSNEIFDVNTFSITTVGVTTSTTKNLVGSNPHRPQHQTADSHITAVQNAGSGSATVTPGLNRLIGRFMIRGETMTGGQLTLDSMEFNLLSAGLAVTNLRIGGSTDVQQSGCGVDSSQANHYLCNALPDGFRTIGKAPLIISVYADVSIKAGSTSGLMQIVFQGTGQIGQQGSIRWSDSTGHYSWMESTTPLENGTTWTVKQ